MKFRYGMISFLVTLINLFKRNSFFLELLDLIFRNVYFCTTGILCIII